MSDKKWTKDQQLAIEAESGTLLVSAAAGSGKTSVLVERIVRKLTSETVPCAPDELLVVTFTNAAAAEMRSRIYVRLSEIMNSSPEEYRRLSGLRARLDEMQVSTMDAFCMKLVREHFHACGIEPDFTVLDSGEETVLSAQAVSETIEFLYEEDPDLFLPLARTFEQGRSDGNLRSGIIALAEFSMSEPDPDVWLDTAADHFSLAPAKESVWGRLLTEYILDGVESAAGQCDKLVDELSCCGELTKKYAGICEYDRLCMDNLREKILRGTWNDVIAALENASADLASRKFTSDKEYASDPHREAAMALRKNIKNILKTLRDTIPADEEEHAQDVEALRPIAEELIKAVKMFNAKLLEKKRAQNSYSFSDITHFALSLLADPSAPDGKTVLARELSAGLREILIDEYQDTNRAQDTLFTCLSQNGDNMFMVGDVKQSIYRFRLASPEIFIDKCERFPYYDGKAKRSKIILSQNFRSRRGITEAVNFVFSGLMSKKCGEIVYNEDERLNFGATRYPEQEEPDVELHVVNNGDQSSGKVEAEYIASLIKEKMAGGLQTFSGGAGRPAEYSDFCILLRSVSHSAGVYAEALRRHGIPVRLDSKEGFFDTAEIRMAVSLLRAADDPSRDIDLLAVMMSPAFGFTPDEAASVRITARRHFGRKKYSLFSALRLRAEEDGGKYAALVDTLDLWRRMSASENAAAVLRRICDSTALMSIAGSMSDGALRIANLRTLQLAADKYCSAGSAGLAGFVRYLETLAENGADIGKGAVSTQGNGVSIMTMHRSKGLEYPFVIIAGLAKRGRSDSSELTVSHELGLGLKRREPENFKCYDTLSSVGITRAKKDAEISEELRIYYVAMTRAKERLFIVTAPKNCEKSLLEMQQLQLPGVNVPPFDIKTSYPAWKWFLRVLAAHPDASALRLGCHYVRSADFSLKTVFAPVPEEEAAPENAVPAAADEALAEELAAAVNFRYRYAPIAGAASKHTASDLSSEHFSPAFFGQSVPAFMYSSALTPAERGTATHRFMQYCDFTACEADAEGERKRLVETGRLTAVQGDGVDMASVAAFFSSEIYARIKKASEVWRERQFTVARRIGDLEKDVPAEFADEKTVVIGKIDLLFIENGKAVIVDYKTDDVKDVAVLRSRYAAQMDMYTDAVRRSLGYEVKECILYSIRLSQWTGMGT